MVNEQSYILSEDFQDSLSVKFHSESLKDPRATKFRGEGFQCLLASQFYS